MNVQSVLSEMKAGAFSIIEQVKPLATMEHIGKILTTEYFLGYIKSYSEIEHLSYPC